MGKKGVLLVLVTLILVIGTGTGYALTTCIFERGCVIPYATYNVAGVDTVVGISILVPATNQYIYWNFYDANGIPLVSGSIPLTVGQIEYSFSLAGGAAGVYQDEVGWLLMTWDNDGVLTSADGGAGNLSANAFLINLKNKDAVFLPVIPLSINDYNFADSITLLSPPNSPLKSMAYGQGANPFLMSRFLVDPSGDPRTTLVIFSALDVPVQLSAVAFSTTGATQQELKIDTPNHKLNVLDMEKIVPAGFPEGALIVQNPSPNVIGIQFSFTFWSVLGAEQTIIANQY